MGSGTTGLDQTAIASPSGAATLTEAGGGAHMGQPQPSTSAATQSGGGGGPMSSSSSALNRKNLEDALVFQMELQKKLHEQLEVSSVIG